MADPTTKAREIERLTDRIVELLPGERELSERVARAVWREVRAARVAAYRDAADELWTEMRWQTELLHRGGPITHKGAIDRFITVRTILTDRADLIERKS